MSNLITREGWLFIDSVFPIRLARWDFRHYIGEIRQETLLTTLRARLKAPNFEILELEPYKKDGGVYVRFRTHLEPEQSLAEVQTRLREFVDSHGGLPSWSGITRGNIWLVKGTPWREDMHRFASPILKVSFDGPDVQEQTMYDLLRPFGRIRDFTNPAPVPAGTLRSSLISFTEIHSATIARNVLHGFDFTQDGSTGHTRFRMAYERPQQTHALKAWISSHPKITLPVLVFLLGSLTYTIFDPLRAVMVEGKMLNWFDYRETNVYKWLKANAVDRLSLGSAKHAHADSMNEPWKERKEAEVAITAYLNDAPTTVTFVHGPQGSGKTQMLESVLQDRKAMFIDCRPLQLSSTDSQLIAALAAQTGYWPVFTYLNSLSSLIDLASVGLIGQKVGASRSLPDQLQQVLEVVTTGLKRVSSSHRAAIEREVKKEVQQEYRRVQDAHRKEKIINGTWHDGRIDCVAGNGIMSELGVGDELLTGDGDAEVEVPSPADEFTSQKSEEVTARKQKTREEIEAVRSLPIVVIRNFESKVGKAREELLHALAQWAAMLAENKIAHVIVLSDNRENAKALAKALPTKPLNSIALSDADAKSALSFVKQKLKDSGITADFTPEQVEKVDRLGGRASDLDSLIHKVRSGQRIGEAVDDIIARGVGEVRKNAFGDDTEDAKNLPWTREQAWVVLRRLAKQSEIPYHDVLVEFPFKGDEAPLRSLEHAELITVITHEGRPASIRPGKPVLRWVFERMFNDRTFQASMDVAFNEKAISSAESTVKACEQELALLREIEGKAFSRWFGLSAPSIRAAFLFNKMKVAEAKIENFEKRNKELKRVLAKGG